jgi:hypothetical protein
VEKLIEAGWLDARQACRSFETATSLATKLREAPAFECMVPIRQLLRKVTISRSDIAVELNRRGLILAVHGDAPNSCADSEVIRLISKVDGVRHRRELKFTSSGADGERGDAGLDNKLIRLIAEANAARQLVHCSSDKPLCRIAADEKRCRTRLTVLIALSCLAPDVVTAIVEGRQPKLLNRQMLLRGSLPFDWDRQRAVLGFAPSST